MSAADAQAVLGRGRSAPVRQPVATSSQPLSPARMHPASRCSHRIELRKGDRPLYRATGFLVRSAHGHLLVTARHNFVGRDALTGEPLDTRTGLEPDRVLVWHHRALHAGQFRPVVQRIRGRDGTALWNEHPDFGARFNVAVLPLLEREWVALDPLALWPYDLAQQPRELNFAPADRVSLVGFPLDIRVSGFAPVWSSASMASEPAQDIDGLPLALVDTPACRESTGSPVVAPDPTSPRLLRLLGVYGGPVSAGVPHIGAVWKASGLADMIGGAPLRFDEVSLRGAVQQASPWLDVAGVLPEGA